MRERSPKLAPRVGIALREWSVSLARKVGIRLSGAPIEVVGIGYSLLQPFVVCRWRLELAFAGPCRCT